MSDAITSEKALFADCWTERELADQRRKGVRTLRTERQRGEGPPYFKDGKQVWYPIPTAREWLLAKMRNPVREPQAPKAPRVSLNPRKGMAHRPVRRRTLESASA